MRKLKMFSSIASLFVMVAFLVYGVYAATSVSFSISATVSFKVTNVYVDIAYGLTTDTGEDIKTATTKGDSGFQALDSSYALSDGDVALSDTTPTKYYVTVSNLHGMDIVVKFNHTWSVKDEEKDVVTLTPKLFEGDLAAATADTAKIVSYTEGNVYTITANQKVTFIVELEVSNADKALTKTAFSIGMSAGLTSSDITPPAQS